MSCLGGGVAGFFSKQKPALLCSVDIRGEIYIIKEEKLYSWHYMCLSLHPETLPNEPHTPVLSLTTMCPFLLWGYASCGPWTPELSAQGLAIYHPLSWQVCNRVSRELGSLGLSLKKSDLRSMTAPDPGINVSVSLINNKSERAQHASPITNPPLPWDVQQSCCGYYFLLIVHMGLVKWGWEFVDSTKNKVSRK